MSIIRLCEIESVETMSDMNHRMCSGSGAARNPKEDVRPGKQSDTKRRLKLRVVHERFWARNHIFRLSVCLDL